MALKLTIKVGEHTWNMIERLANQLNYQRETVVELAISEFISKYAMVVEAGEIKVISVDKLDPERHVKLDGMDC